jgi:hypothetical protein
MVILHDGPVLAHRGKEMAQRLTAGWESECDVWPFQQLSRACGHASVSASMANIIIVTVGASGELPAWLKVWFETWSPRRTSAPRALAFLLDGDNGPSAQRSRDFLQKVAERCRMDFFCNFDASSLPRNFRARKDRAREPFVPRNEQPNPTCRQSNPLQRN